MKAAIGKASEIRRLDLAQRPDLNRRPDRRGLRFVVLVGAVLLMTGLTHDDLGTAVAGGGTAYFEALSDLPLAPGLTEVTAEALVFDKPDGRIVEVVATGRTSVEDVVEFYARTLPELGWTMTEVSGDDRAATLRLEREGEALVVHVNGNGGGTTRLEVEVSPE